MGAHSPLPWVVMMRPEVDGERLGDGSVVGGPTGRDEYDAGLGVCSLADLREAAEGEGEPYSVCRPCEADARLIVRAVNAHAALEAACRAAEAELKLHCVFHGDRCKCACCAALARARAALALLGERGEA
jgi:hypothetical protein